MAKKQQVRTDFNLDDVLAAGYRVRPIQAAQPSEDPVAERSTIRAVGDVGLSLGQGAVGAFKALTDLGGADNAVSQGLGDMGKFLGEQKSEQSKATLRNSMERIQAAEESGSTLEEVKAYMGMLWDQPGEMLAQGVGSFATLGLGKAAAALKLASAAKAAGVSKEVFMASAAGRKAIEEAAKFGFKANVGIGAGMGVGAVKGSQYEQSEQNALKQGMSPEEAQGLATEAQAYGGPGTMQQVLGGGLGALAAATGPIERLVAGRGAKQAGMGTMASMGKGFAVEGSTEGAQGAQERFAGNTAAIDAGVLAPEQRMRGVAGQGLMEGTIGGVIGAAAGPFEEQAPVNLPQQERQPQAPPVVDVTAPPPGPLARAANLGARLTPTPMADLLGGSADPLAGQITAERQQQEDAALAADQLEERTTSLTGMSAMGALGGSVDPLQDILSNRRQAVQDMPSGMTPRTPRTDALDLDLPTDPVANYVDDLRQVNTPAAKLYVRDFDAGSITRADVEQRMAAERGKTPDDRLAAAAAEGLRMNPKGDPFKTMMAAQRAAKTTPGDVIEVQGGYAIRRQQERTNEPATPTAEPQRTQAPADEPAAADADGGQPVPPATDEAAGALTGATNVQNAPQPAAGTQAQTPASEAPAPARGDAAAAAGVPAAPGAGDVQADGVTADVPEAAFGDMAAADLSTNQPKIDTSAAPAQETPETAQVENLARQKAIERVDKGTTYFGTQEKADDFIKKGAITGTHEVVQTKTGRFEVKAKAAAPAAPAPTAAEPAAPKETAIARRNRLIAERKAASSDLVGTSGFSDLEKALQAVSRDSEADGDVAIVAGGNEVRYVSQQDADSAAQKAIDSGVQPVPFQIHNATGIRLGDVDGVLERLKKAPPVSQPKTETPAETSTGAAPASQPDLLGRNSQPMSEGGKPFKTEAAAKKEKKLHPTKRVVKVDGGYALADKTPKQIAADEAKAKRLRTFSSGTPGKPMSAHEFVVSKGGMATSARADLGVDGNPRVGNRTLFAGKDKPGLTLAQAAELLREAGYIKDESETSAADIIKRSLNIPQYTPEGVEQVAEQEREAEFQDYLAAEQSSEPEDDWSKLTPEELADTGYNEYDEVSQAEIRALVAQAEAMGIDADSIQADVAEQTRNATQQDYENAAKTALQAAIQGGNASGRQDSGQAGAEQGTETAADEGLTAPTQADIEAQQERAEQAERDKAAADKAADAAAAKERERAEVKRLSEAAADTFELGGDAMANLTGQGDIFGSAPEPAAEPDTPKLTQAEAANLMAWQDMGTKDGVKRHILTFYRSKEDADAKRGRMTVATVTKGDRSATAWTVEGDDQTFGALAMAKKRGMEAGMARAVSDGFVEPAAKPAAKKDDSVTGRLTDAGEELIRNRRGKLKGLAWADVSDMNDTLKVAQVVKANVWPRPDYAKMVEEGAPAWKAAAFKAVYDKLAAAPATRTAPTDADLRSYIETMHSIRDLLVAELDRVAALPDGAELWKSLKAENVFGKAFPIPTDARPLYGRPSAFDRNSEQGKANNRRALLIGGNSAVQALQFDYRVLSKVKDLLAEGFPAKQEAWQKSWEVRANETRDSDVPEAERTGEPQQRFYVFEKGSRYRMAKGGQDGGYATQEQAEAYARSLTARKKEVQPPSRGLDLDQASRTGPDWRGGKNVTAQDVMDRFGFRGLNLGEYVKAKQDVAQLHLNHVYDAFSDLADLMGVPPKAMSLNGTLGVAIGAQGSGKALAHFAPGVNEINITRDSGAGALAHEFGHAMDHYFATQYGRATSVAKRPYLSASVLGMRDNGGVRPEVIEAMREVMQTINSRPMTEAEARKYMDDQRERNQKYLDRWVKEFSGNRGADVPALNAAAAKLKSGDIGEANGNDVEANIAEFIRAAGLKPGNSTAGNAVMIAYRLRDLADEASFLKTHIPQVDTEYTKASNALDAKKTGEGYWSTPWEKFARAFETFAMDALKDRQRESLYLSGLVDSKGWAAWSESTGKSIPYPAGDERLAMQQAFQKLADTIQTKEDDAGNVAMFSRSKEFDAEVDAAIEAGMTDDKQALRRQIDVGVRTPAVLRMLGVADKPVYTNRDLIAKMHIDHGVPKAQLKNLGALLGNPAMVFKSDTQAGRLVVVTDLVVSGKPVLIAVEPNGASQGLEVVYLPSAYPKDNADGAFTAWIKSGKLLYADKSRSRLLATNAGLQLPGVIARPVGFKPTQYMTDADVDQASMSRAIAGQGVSRKDAQAIADAIRARWANAPQIVVAANMQDAAIPERVRQEDAKQRSQGASGEPEGFYYGGKVYVVASALNQPADVVRVLFHEALGHAGLRGVFGEGLTPILKQLAALRRAEVAAKAKQYGLDMSIEAERLQAAEEVLAEFAQTRPEIGYVQRAIAAVRAFLRNHIPGFGKMMLTDAEIIQQFILPARRFVERGPGGGPRGGQPVPAFSRSGTGASVVVDQIRQFDVAGKTGNTLKHYLGMALQTLGRRQLVDLYQQYLPQLTEYDRLVQNMEAEKNDTGAAADELARAWGSLDGDTKRKGEELKLAELMHDATLAKIDPQKDHQAGDDRAQWASLRAKFNALDPKAQALYVQARDMYADHYAKVRKAIAERIERSDMSDSQKKQTMARMDDDFFKKTKGVYFPLARFGSYVMVVKDASGEVVNVSRAETLNEAETTRKQLQQVFPREGGFNVSKVLKDAEFNPGRDAVGKGFMADLLNVLDKQGVDEALRDSVSQLYLASLPDLSWAKHGIHRKGTPGFSQDARRAFAQNMFHGARHLAKLRYADRLQGQLEAMDEHIKAYREIEEYDSVKAQQVLDEMVKRHDSLMNPKTHPLSTALTSIGFVFYLGISPAAAMVNLSQTALVAYPIMGAKWGFTKAGAALLRASKQTVAAKNDISKVLQGDELAAYEHAVKDGTIDVTMAHDLAGISQGEDAKVTWAMRPVMRAASFLFHHAERFNRQATFIASFRLAKEAGADNARAFEEAKKATYDGHFDYGAANRPRIMQGNVAKVVLLFRQYGQNMVYTLSRQAYLSMKGLTPADRAEARKQLGGILALHAAAAGALGLPIVGALLSAASFIGGDDDEPWDAEVALKNAMADAMGPKAAEVMAHGLSRLTPWDISSRVALDRLILPDVREGLEGQKWAESLMVAAIGPVGGIFTGMAKGLQSMSEGKYGRGLEEMLPVALRNPIKAMRYAEEGAVDKTGVVIKDEVSMAGVLGQASGFAPSEVRLATEGKSAIIGHDRARMERRQTLMAQFAQARMAGDTEGMAEVRKDIERFNSKNPTRRITPLNLAQSVRARQRRIDGAEQGVYLPKNRRDAMEAGRFAAEPV